MENNKNTDAIAVIQTGFNTNHEKLKESSKLIFQGQGSRQRQVEPIDLQVQVEDFHVTGNLPLSLPLTGLRGPGAWVALSEPLSLKCASILLNR